MMRYLKKTYILRPLGQWSVHCINCWRLETGKPIISWF